MSTNKRTDKEVQKTLDALDGMERATTDDFFYSRLSAKLEHREKESESTPEYGFAFSMAAVFIVLILNVMYLSNYSPAIFNSQNTSSDREVAVEELAADYQVFDLNYYETFDEE